MFFMTPIFRVCCKKVWSLFVLYVTPPLPIIKLWRESIIISPVDVLMLNPRSPPAMSLLDNRKQTIIIGIWPSFPVLWCLVCVGLWVLAFAVQSNAIFQNCSNMTGKSFIWDKSEKMSGNISKMLQKTVGSTLPQGATKGQMGYKLCTRLVNGVVLNKMLVVSSLR